MDLILSKLYDDRRKAKRLQPSFMLGLAGNKAHASPDRREASWESSLAAQDSIASLQSLTTTSIPKAQKLPSIQRSGRPVEGSQTARESDHGNGRNGDLFLSASPRVSKEDSQMHYASNASPSHRSNRFTDLPTHPSERPSNTGRLPTVNPPGELNMEFQGANGPPDRQYYTLKVRVEDVTLSKEEGEDDPGLQVSLSVDGMSCMTKVAKRLNSSADDKVVFPKESFIFQPEGSPIGTLVMVKLLGIRPRAEAQDLGTSLIDLSAVPVGGQPLTILSPLNSETGRSMQVTLTIKMYYRRKSFTFSYLNVEPVFRRNGYAVTADGLQMFPMPYKKKGMPAGVSFFGLKYAHKLAEDVPGHQVWRAMDKTGRSYTVKKFLIMDTACRVLFCSELDGILDCEPGAAVELCDAFLDGVRLSIVTDDLGGSYLRDALKEKGAAPEMVTSIVLRQVSLLGRTYGFDFYPTQLWRTNFSCSFRSLLVE
jgi:hypothetical protein